MPGLRVYKPDGTLSFDENTRLLNLTYSAYVGQNGGVTLTGIKADNLIVMFRPDNKRAKFWWRWDPPTQSIYWQGQIASNTWIDVFSG